MGRFAMSLLAIVIGIGLDAAGHGAEPTYWQDVRPILRKNCTICHSAKNLAEPDISGSLALDTLEAVLRGGKKPVVVPGKSSESLLVSILRHPKVSRRMPRDADPLSDETVAVIRHWIDAGAKAGEKPAESESPGTVVTAPRTRRLDVVVATRIAKPANVSVSLPAGPLAPIAALAFSPDGRLLAAGSYGRVAIWDLTKMQLAKVLTNVLGSVNDLRFSPDGKSLAIAGGQPSAKGMIRIVSVADWKIVADLGGHTDVVSSIAFSPDGSTLASASFDKTVRIWEWNSATLKRSITGHSDFVYAVAFGPGGDWIVSASKDRTARMSDIKTGNSRLTFSGADQDILAVAVSPDGSQVVTSGLQPGIAWWNAKTAERARLQGGHDIAVHELTFDRGGKLLASAGADKTVRVWDAANGSSRRVIPTGTIMYAVAIHPDGKTIAGGGADGLVRIWETTSGRPLVTLLNETDGWLTVTPEGYFTASDSAIARFNWKSSGRTLARDSWSSLNNPAMVLKSFRCEKVPDATLPLSRN